MWDKRIRTAFDFRLSAGMYSICTFIDFATKALLASPTSSDLIRDWINY